MIAAVNNPLHQFMASVSPKCPPVCYTTGVRKVASMAAYFCDVCGSRFTKSGTAAARQVHHFCSVICRRQHEGRTQVECMTCGILFYKKRAEREARPLHFCSMDCYRVYQRQNMVVTKVCPTCNQIFTPSGYGKMRHDQVYCSHTCKGAGCRGARNPAWMGGSPAYRGPDWPTIQKQVVTMDGGRCVLCGSTDDLNVHHIEPYRISQKNEMSNLATLCDRCHGCADRDYIRGVDATEQAIRQLIQVRHA